MTLINCRLLRIHQILDLLRRVKMGQRSGKHASVVNFGFTFWTREKHSRKSLNSNYKRARAISLAL